MPMTIGSVECSVVIGGSTVACQEHVIVIITPELVSRDLTDHMSSPGGHHTASVVLFVAVCDSSDVAEWLCKNHDREWSDSWNQAWVPTKDNMNSKWTLFVSSKCQFPRNYDSSHTISGSEISFIYAIAFSN